MTHQPPLPSFKQISKYKIEGLISRGGMSLLYLANDPDTQKPLIVKVLLPQYVLEQDVVDRFLNEAHIIALADHPNIVRLVDSGRWEGGLYIAMEFIKGSSLRKIFQHQPYTLKRAMDVLLQVAYALAHLHAHGVVHGDLKPENILIDEQGKVKVIDFGISTVLSDEKKQTPARFLGTPIYMSPELGLDRHNLSFQSDIFSLGIIAYELAVGKISHGRIIVSLAPKGLQKLLQKALQPRPSDRYANMCDFISDLSGYIKSGGIEKDKHGSDQFLEVFEKLESIQNALLPHDVPLWDDFKMDLANVEAMGLSGLYIDFFALDASKKLIFIAESTKKGPEGLIGACMLRSTLRSFLEPATNIDPSEVPRHLLEQIEKNIFTGHISFACLILDSSKKTYAYYQYQFGLFACIRPNVEIPALIATNKVPNSSIRIAQGTYDETDKFLLIAISDKTDQPLLLVELTKEMLLQHPQSQSEAILRKIRLNAEAVQNEQPLSVILVEPVNSYGKKLPPLK